MTPEVLERLEALEKRVSEIERALSGDTAEARAALTLIAQPVHSPPKSRAE